jgi:RNA polymerase sigma-70 factor, ECF subfamily
MQVPDLWLVQKAKKGDAVAMGVLFERHAKRVYNLLLRLCGNTALAEDLTQETFLTAQQRLTQWRGVGAFSTWLCGIAVKHHLATRRKTQIMETLDANDIENTLTMDASSDPLAHYIEQEALLVLEAAIAALPTSCREVFVLVRVEEMRYREVAELLEIPLGTVQSRLARATNLLQHALAPTSEGVIHKGVGYEKHAL